MTHEPKPYELKGAQLKAYRRGFLDRASESYFPGGLDTNAYNRGWRDGAKNEEPLDPMRGVEFPFADNH